jgi:hypothetical protein
LVELVEEGQVEQAEAGWRELLYEQKARLRGRVTELDIRHAAARMIQVGFFVKLASFVAGVDLNNDCDVLVVGMLRIWRET